MVKKGKGRKKKKSQLREPFPEAAQAMPEPLATEKKPVEITVTSPEILDVTVPDWLVLTELLSQAQALRKMPPADLRRPDKEKYIREVLLNALPSWEVLQQRCTTAAQELAAGKTTEFLRVIERYSLVGFDQLRMNPTVKKVTDGWCLDNVVNGKKSQGRKHLKQLCKSLLRSLRGRRPKLTPAERKSNKQVSSNAEKKRKDRATEKAEYQKLKAKPVSELRTLARDSNPFTPKRNAAKRRLKELRLEK